MLLLRDELSGKLQTSRISGTGNRRLRAVRLDAALTGTRETRNATWAAKPYVYGCLGWPIGLGRLLNSAQGLTGGLADAETFADLTRKLHSKPGSCKRHIQETRLRG